MHTFPAKARTAADGTLSLTIPAGFPDADVDVLVVLDGEDLVRHPQGETSRRTRLD